jgi:hypothetical protein
MVERKDEGNEDDTLRMSREDLFAEVLEQARGYISSASMRAAKVAESVKTRAAKAVR